MTGVLLVGLALGGVCAYVWSAIVQAETPDDARVARVPLGPRALTLVKLAPGKLRLAQQRRRAARVERALERGPRRLRFEETAELTVPNLVASAAPSRAAEWKRPSRMLSAVQLVLLILLVGGAVAAATLGIAQIVARTVASH